MQKGSTGTCHPARRRFGDAGDRPAVGVRCRRIFSALRRPISPDGSRVVFAGKTKRGRSCHDGALFAVDTDGGPAEVLWESHVPQNGIVRYPMFSPDGTQIAFADGYCNSSHSVWVMNADGSDAHQIVSSDIGPLGATHVRGLAWSAAGDRIALQVDQGTYFFATDGSDFTLVGDDRVLLVWSAVLAVAAPVLHLDATRASKTATIYDARP